MVQVSCLCGWTSSEPSRLQADVAVQKHRSQQCPNYGTCAVCTELGPGARRALSAGEPEVFVCNDCNDIHPRDGNYAFGSIREPSRAGKRKGSS